MQQRYQTHFDSFQGLITVVKAIESFSSERFLASLHSRTNNSLQKIADTDAQILRAIAMLQTQHAQLLEYAQTFNSQFVTRNNHYFNSAHQLLRKIHTGVQQLRQIYIKFTPNSYAAIPHAIQPSYNQPSIYDRSPLSTQTYNRTLFGIDSYPPEVQQLQIDMARFFSQLRDSLLVCLEVIRQEEYIRRDPTQCHELYNDFKQNQYLTIKKHINSINITTSEFNPLNNPAIDLRQSCSTEYEFAQKAFHNQEYDDVCTLVTKELVEEQQRGEYTPEELLLFPDSKQKIRQVRYIITHFDDYIPSTYKRKILPSNYVACLMSFCSVPLLKNKAFVEYFSDTYKKASQKFKPPSNSAVNQSKRDDWKLKKEFAQLISQWENVEIA